MNLKDYKPGQVVTVSGFVSQLHYLDTPTWHTIELASSGYVTICPHDITFTIPEGFNAVAAEVSSIEKALSEAAESYHQTVASLRERKQQLLQLTFDDGEVMDAETPACPPQTFQDIDDDFPF